MARRTKSIYEHDTRLRLIDAAGSLFAEKGFSATTIRDICEKAGANIASVNYHFSGKMELYEATLQYTLLKDDAPAKVPLKAKAVAPEEALYQLVLGMLRNIRLTDKPEWFPQLLRREMLFPTAEFQALIQRLLVQDFEKVRILIADIIPGASKYSVHASALTLLGQVKSVAMESDIVLEALFPDLKLDNKGCQKMARHITDTTIDGIKVCYGKPVKKAKA